MKKFRSIYCLLIYSFMLLVNGCHLTITVDHDGTIGDDNTSVLPDPPGAEPGPPLDETQQARQDEVTRFTREVIYHNGTITQTIQLPSGDIIDGIDRTTLPPLPYPLPSLPFTPEALPAGVELPVPEFENYLYRYTVGGAPSASESSMPNMGAVGYMNQFRPNPLSRIHPGEEVDVSVLDGKQVEHLAGIFQMPGTGDWWLYFDTDLLGYYPRDMFAMLYTGGCGSAYYAEAARKKPYPPPPPGTPWAKTEVGSGQPGKAAQPRLTAYVRNPQYVDPTSWYPVNVQQQAYSVFADSPEACYTELLDLSNGYVWLGGLGGYNSACTVP